MTDKISIPCGGKVNLYLKVERRRPDGFHDIRTVFLPFHSPADTISISFAARPGIEVESDFPGLPSGTANLAGKAAERFFEAADIKPAISIRIEKRLPVAGGVGGGSANSGRVLRALNEHYKVFDETTLLGIAAEIGSDVPFFLCEGTAVAAGRGEELEYRGRHDVPLVLAAPGFPITAKWAYQHVDPKLIAPSPAGTTEKIISALDAGDMETLAGLMENDLAPAIEEKCPIYWVLRETVEKHGALRAMISGSGSSMLALTRDHEQAKELAKSMATEMPDIPFYVLGGQR
ncbi:MAG: 4-(cytidine 5'-diphospho)-2-C-methyl-D-erythritol kinase [Victivallaceae bacterium]|nr:4-(cytidine 5'-diphospho)-2-C-methyl-D-erythritol kinase [Victivallaceae bacterium]